MSGRAAADGSGAPRRAPALAPDAHKGDAGRVVAIAGSRWMPGAAVLVARAAQRAGAGLVAVGCLDDALAGIVPAAAPEAVLLDLTDFAPGDVEAWIELGALLDARDPHAVLAGPGIGDDARARALLAVLIDETRTLAGCPLVLDADALNALDGRPERLRERGAPVVITPHPGEAARLLGRAVPADGEGRLAAARELVERSGAIVCLKGHGTVVADRERAEVNRTGNPGMATAGAGDVLAGVLLALLAPCRALPDGAWTPFDAARLAVHVHGRAGDLAAAELGPRSVVASDLVRFLPAAFAGLERG